MDKILHYNILCFCRYVYKNTMLVLHLDDQQFMRITDIYTRVANRKDSKFNLCSEIVSLSLEPNCFHIQMWALIALFSLK